MLDKIQIDLNKLINKTTDSYKKLIIEKNSYDEKLRAMPGRALSLAASKRYRKIQEDLIILKEWLDELYKLNEKVTKDMQTKNWTEGK